MPPFFYNARSHFCFLERVLRVFRDVLDPFAPGQTDMALIAECGRY